MKAQLETDGPCNIALKEWAIVCEAIRLGHQHVLLRTGGIAEQEGVFTTQFDSFWLFPTRFHQSTELVRPEFAEPLQRSFRMNESHASTSRQESLKKVAGTTSTDPLSSRGETHSDRLIRLQLFCKVIGVDFVADRAKLKHLSSWHVLNQEIVEQRFDYREPGLFLLTIQAYSLPEPHLLLDESRYAGCKSWVELTSPLETSHLSALTPIEATEAIRNQISARIV